MVSFIISKEEKVKNVMQVIGNYDNFCPYFLLKVTKEISKKYFLPAQVNSEFVNVRWFLRININENLKKGCQTNG